MYDAYDCMLIFTWCTSKIKDKCDLVCAISFSAMFTFSLYCDWQLRGPNKKSNVNNEDELEVQIMDKLDLRNIK